MRKTTCCLAAFLSLGAIALISAQDTDPPAEPADQPAAQAAPQQEAPVLIVHAIRNVPVQELTTALSAIFSDKDDVKIVPEPTTNRLLIRVSQSRSAEVLKLLDQIDRPPRLLAIQLWLLKTQRGLLSEQEQEPLSGAKGEVQKHIEDLESSGRAYVADRLEVNAVENQRAMFQLGSRTPIVTGTTVTASRTRVATYREANFGTLLSVIGQASEDGGITLQVQFEKSELDEPLSDDAGGSAEAEGDAAKSDAAGGDVRPPGTATVTSQTTLQLRSGHALLASTAVSHAEGVVASYIVVAAEVVESAAAGQGLAFRAFSAATPPGSPARGLSSRVPAGFSSGGFARPSRSSGPPAANQASRRGGFVRRGRDSSAPSARPPAPSARPPAAGARPPAAGARPPAAASATPPASPRTEANRRMTGLLARSHVMNAYDVNQNDILEPAELAAMPTRPPAEYDADGDGQFSFEEVVNWIQALRDSVTSRSGAAPSSGNTPGVSAEAAADNPADAADAADTEDANAAAKVDPTYLRYAAGIISQYDADGDGKLSAAEQAQMSKNYSAADTNRDGFLSAEEFAIYIQNLK